MRVVHNAQHRRVLGCLASSDARRPDQERLDVPVVDAERDPRSARACGPGTRTMERITGRSNRCRAPNVQRRIRLRSLGRQHPHTLGRGTCAEILEQRRLPDPRLPMHDHGSDLPDTRTVKDRTQPVSLGCPPDGHDATLPPPRNHRAVLTGRSQATTAGVSRPGLKRPSSVLPGLGKCPAWTRECLNRTVERTGRQCPDRKLRGVVGTLRADHAARARSRSARPDSHAAGRRRRRRWSTASRESRVYYRRKVASGKTRMEAMRWLKRRISDAISRHLRTG